MKKSIYLLAITLITIFCILYGMLQRGGHFFPFVFSSPFSSGSAVEDAFDSIHIDGEVLDLTIKEEGSDYTISYECTESLTPKWNVSNGKLELTNQCPKNPLHIGNNNCRVTLTVPEGSRLKNITVHTDVGNITLNDISMEQCSLTADVGNITLKDTALQEGSLSSDTGNITLTDSTFTTLDARSDIGNIKIDSDQSLSDYSFVLSADVGSIKINRDNMERFYQKDGSAGKLTASSSIGDVKVEY